MIPRDHLRLYYAEGVAMARRKALSQPTTGRKPEPEPAAKP